MANRSQIAPNTPHGEAIAIEARANASSTRSRVMMRKPSRISRTTGSRSDLAGGGGSGQQVEPRNTADTTNDTASTRMAVGALNSWTRKPLIPNAVSSAADPDAASAPRSPASSSRPTIVGR